jgi:peptidoglycan/LPS O-acetylase OafA/YrhL
MNDKKPKDWQWWFVIVIAIVWIPFGTAMIGFGSKLLADDHALPTVGIIFCTLGIIYFFAGICVFIARPWAYGVVRIVACLFVTAVPIGTILGLLALYGLKRNKHHFDQESQSR